MVKQIKREDFGFDIKTHHAPATIWSIMKDDINQDGRDEYLLGGLDNHVYLEDEKDEILWSYDVKGIPVDIACGDTNGDGKKEIAIVSYDSQANCYLLNSEGKLIWKFSVGSILKTVAMLDWNNDGKDEILGAGYDGYLYILDGNGKLLRKEDLIHRENGLTGRGISRVRGANLNADQDQAIVLSVAFYGVVALNKQLKVLWSCDCRGDKELTGSFPGAEAVLTSMEVGDLDNDGKDEIIVGSNYFGHLVAIDHNGKKLWEDKDITHAYNNQLVCMGDFLKDGHQMVAALSWSPKSLKLYDAKGKILYHTSTPFPFLYLYSDKKRRLLYLGSGLRDHNFYELSIKKGLPNKLISLKKSEIISNNIDQVREYIDKIPFKKRKKKAHIMLGYLPLSFNDPVMVEIYNFVRQKSNENVEFEFELSVREKNLHLKRPFFDWGHHLSQEELIKLAQFLEENKIPFYYIIDHYGNPFIGLNTVEETLKAAPDYCRGFEVYEEGGLYSYSIPLWYEYVRRMEKVAELCEKYGGKKLIINEPTTACWLIHSSDPKGYALLLKPEYKDIIVPMIKTNGHCCADLEVGALLGLWKAGLVNEWGYSTNEDNLSLGATTSLIKLCPADIILRMDTIGASLGATYFRIEEACYPGRQSYLNISNTKLTNYIASRGVSEPKRSALLQQFVQQGLGLKIDPEAKRHRDLFHELLRKGVIPSMDREELVNISPVAFWQKIPEKIASLEMTSWGEKLLEGIFGLRSPNILTVTSDYISSYIYHISRYVEGLLPRTPYGYFIIIPAKVNPKKVSGIKKFWQTDGKYIYANEKKIPAPEAKEKILNSFKKNGAHLPFQAENVFLSAQRLNKDKYLIYLLDAHYFEPEKTDTILNINLPGDRFKVMDVLSQTYLKCEDKKVSLQIPAGAFRILKVEKEK